MSRNGSGGYSLPSNSWNPATNGVSATAADWQLLINDVATAIQQSISADGQTPITGNLAMGGNKLTGLSAGSGTGQSLSYEQLFSQGALTDIASASTTDIGGQLSTLLRVTGTTGISSFGTNYNGPRFLIFQGILTLTHSSSLVLPGAANITTAANDALIAIPISGGWQVAAYTRAAGIAASAGPLASSGITGAAASGANSDITSLTGLTSVPTVISNSWAPGTRQTVRSGPVDSNGFAAFGGSTGSTTVTASGALYVTAANGILDRNGSITNPSWTGLTANAFLYLDIAADGTCTTGSTTLAPNYRWGGADVVTSGQATFNIQEMQMKVGNGSAAVQTYRVFVGEVTASGTVSAITWYQPMGRYSNEQSTIAVSTAYSFNHNIGSSLLRMIPWIECKTTDLGYAVGDRVYSIGSDGNGSAFCGAQMWSTYKTCGFTMGSGAGAGVQLPNKGTGSIGATTVANWKVGFEVIRGW